MLRCRKNGKSNATRSKARSGARTEKKNMKGLTCRDPPAKLRRNHSTRDQMAYNPRGEIVFTDVRSLSRLSTGSRRAGPTTVT